MRIMPMIVASFILQIFTSASAEDKHVSTACTAINNALLESHQSFASSINIGGREASCEILTQSSQWICTVYDKRTCNPLETTSGKESSSPTTDNGAPEILEIYDKTIRDVTFCIGNKVSTPLEFIKFNSNEDAYASKGSQFTVTPGENMLYIMLRVHAFIKDKDVCRTGTVSLEFRKPNDLNSFERSEQQRYFGSSH
ncbi:TPA: hypothetical protein L9L01_005089 [Klebsiella pneumoniae]|nr:hypothetical protein [Klebsiella pneumoniae]